MKKEKGKRASLDLIFYMMCVSTKERKNWRLKITIFVIINLKKKKDPYGADKEYFANFVKPQTIFKRYYYNANTGT